MPSADRTPSYASRRTALATSLPDEVEALLVTGWENVRYLTGFTGSHGAVLVPRSGGAVLATDGRYLLQAAAEAPDIECVEVRRAGPALVERARREGANRLGFEAHHVTVDGLRALEDAAEGTALVPAGRPVETLRTVKDDTEVDALRTACAVTDRAFAAVILTLRPGVTERDAAWALATEMRLAGADGPGFDSIVAFGDNAAIPHHQPTDRELRRGDLVKADFGALVGGYHADMTRTVVVGPAADWQRDLHAAVAAIQQELSAAATVGTLPKDLDAAMRERITALGHSVGHGLGHGVGLEIHEDPFLTEGSTAGPLAPGMTVTVEPGIYLAGRGGVRIEDTLLVGPDGPEPLTRSPRELLEV